MGEVKNFKTFENGFCMVTVDIAQDRDWIMNSGPYFMDGYGFYLKKWTMNFDPTKEVIKEIPIWIRLRNLPQEY